MERNADFRRLNRALDDAVAALPEHACAGQANPLRRQCREVLLQTRERARRLSEMFGRPGSGA